MDGTCEDIRGREIDVNDSKLHSAPFFQCITWFPFSGFAHISHFMSLCLRLRCVFLFSCQDENLVNPKEQLFGTGRKKEFCSVQFRLVLQKMLTVQAYTGVFVSVHLEDTDACQLSASIM